MAVFLLLTACMISVATAALQFDHGVNLPTTRPLNIAHRGSSGVFPEHSATAYRHAIDHGADVIECDVTMTKDLRLVCLHDPYISRVTDIASHPEFADRKRIYTVEDKDVDDWFCSDFTLAELRTLRLKQGLPERDPSYDGMYNVTTLSEFLTIARDADRPIGVYPEIKNPELINALPVLNGQRFEDLVLAELTSFGYSKADDPCFIQSFSEDSLLYLSAKTNLRLVMLVWSDEHFLGPHLNDSRLADWGRVFYGLGAWKPQVALYDGYKSHITGTTSLVTDAHEAGLKIHLYTFRNEDGYLGWDFKQDPLQEYEYFMKLGIDGFFTDFPQTFSNYLDATYRVDVCASGGATLRMYNVQFWAVMGIILFMSYI